METEPNKTLADSGLLFNYSRTSFIRSVKYSNRFFFFVCVSTTCTVYEYVFKQCSVQQLFRVRPKVTGKPKIRDVWEISDLEGEKDSNVDHREEITDFVQSTPRFQESDDVETWMACDAEDCEFQMLNGDEDCDFRARRVRSCRR
ncbi:UNVERIFIED_CONTAM: hypothetical protein NCL1_17205 [Trichonephila clavipes]